MHFDFGSVSFMHYYASAHEWTDLVMHDATPILGVGLMSANVSSMPKNKL